MNMKHYLSHAQTYREALMGASSLLQEIDENEKIAEWMLRHLVRSESQGWPWILDEPIQQDHLHDYTQWIQRVSAGEPYQYVLGEAEFYGREFQITPGVLIPRPETEMLVEKCLQLQSSVTASFPTGLDIGTGSGAIAISMALEWQGLRMFAVDVSEQAVQVAARNAERYQADVSVHQFDVSQDHFLDSFSQSIPEKVHFIISNPPYISKEDRETIDAQVLRHEPHLALFAAEEGTYFYRKIVEHSQNMLLKPGLIAFEVGWGQAEQVVGIIRKTYPTATCHVEKDLQGVARIVWATVED